MALGQMLAADVRHGGHGARPVRRRRGRGSVQADARQRNGEEYRVAWRHRPRRPDPRRDAARAGGAARRRPDDGDETHDPRSDRRRRAARRRAGAARTARSRRSTCRAPLGCWRTRRARLEAFAAAQILCRTGGRRRARVGPRGGKPSCSLRDCATSRKRTAGCSSTRSPCRGGSIGTSRAPSRARRRSRTCAVRRRRRVGR